MNEQNENILQPEVETNISPNQVTIRRRGSAQQKKKKQAKTKATVFMVLRRTGLCLLTLVLVLVLGAWLILNMLFNGTNDQVKKVLTMSLREPSGTKWLPQLFIGKDGVAAIENEGSDAVDIVWLSQTGNSNNPDSPSGPIVNPNGSMADPKGEFDNYPDGLYIEEVKGKTFNAYGLYGHLQHAFLQG